MIKAGTKFPEFTLMNQDGKSVKLADYAGKWLVVYVYPKDDTPNCTIQANAFTAHKMLFEEAGITVVGLSPDGVTAHKNFCNKFSLSIDLLADPDCQLLNALGIGQTEWQGTMYWDRTTFVVDPSGLIARVYEKVVAQGHDEVLLKDISELKLQSSAR